MTTEQPLMSPSQVAELLNCKTSTVYAWAKRGEIPCYKIGGLLRFDPAEISEWVKGARVNPVAVSNISTKALKNSEIDRVINGAIASFKGSRYNAPIKGKPDQSGPGRR